jgi:NAD(P)-dependent dehydrogenase (short-subunit alcohol dehydrogenase family)
MTGPLHDQTVLVTGGGRSIGRAIVLRLAEAGARVIVNYLRDEAAAQARFSRRSLQTCNTPAWLAGSRIAS